MFLLNCTLCICWFNDTRSGTFCSCCSWALRSCVYIIHKKRVKHTRMVQQLNGASYQFFLAAFCQLSINLWDISSSALNKAFHGLVNVELPALSECRSLEYITTDHFKQTFEIGKQINIVLLTYTSEGLLLTLLLEALLLEAGSASASDPSSLRLCPAGASAPLLASILTYNYNI